MVLDTDALARIQGISIPTHKSPQKLENEKISKVCENRQSNNKLLFSDDYKGSNETKFEKLKEGL